MRPLSPGLTTRPPLSRSSSPLGSPPPTLLAPTQLLVRATDGGGQGVNESIRDSHSSLGLAVGLSPPGRSRLCNHRLCQKSFPLAQGLAEIQEHLPFLSLFLGIREITVELDVLVFRTQRLELGFLLLFLKTEQDEKKTATTTTSGGVQEAGGKPSGNLRPVEDRQRHTDGKVIANRVATVSLCALLLEAASNSHPRPSARVYSALTSAVTCFLPSEIKIRGFREVELPEIAHL